jgi:ABC-type uncharacterized transport system substrate-binding protein
MEMGRSRQTWPVIAALVVGGGCALWAATMGVGADKVVSRLVAVFPETGSVAVVYSDPGTEAYVVKAEAECKSREIKFAKYRIESYEEIPATVRFLFGKIDTLWIMDDPIISQTDTLNYILLNSVQQRWKTVVQSEEWVKRGGLFCLSESGESVINKGILDFLGLSVPEGSGPVKYIGEKKK